MAKSMGAAVPDDWHEHDKKDPWYHKKPLTPYEQHVQDKYLRWQHEEAARAKKAARSWPHRGTDFARDADGRWTAATTPGLRLDWMSLDFDLGVKEIIAVDGETDESVVYRRLQASADDECLWVSDKDVVTPEGHPSERLMEMWPSGFWVAKRHTPGFEPPHSCPPRPAACAYCRAMKNSNNK